MTFLYLANFQLMTKNKVSPKSTCNFTYHYLVTMQPSNQSSPMHNNPSQLTQTGQSNFQTASGEFFTHYFALVGSVVDKISFEASGSYQSSLKGLVLS